MDILAARKKAAEQASARNKPDQETVAPAAQPKQEQEAPPASAVPDVAPPAMVEESRAAASMVSAVEAFADTTETIPASSISEPEETRQQEIELLSFRLGGEEYVVLVSDVREVLKLYQPTMVPNTPDYILGVMSLRGTMQPIIDLRKRFGLAEGVQDEKMRIVVVSSADEAVGLLVDRVTGVFTIHPDEIRPAPENIEQGGEFLRGIVRKDEKLYILLDLEKAVGV
jgi:purine-binding chemotaxis protein CheW